jgi:hypothetical protein
LIAHLAANGVYKETPGHLQLASDSGLETVGTIVAAHGEAANGIGTVLWFLNIPNRVKVNIEILVSVAEHLGK